MQDDLILFDWLSFTSKHHSPDSIINLLGFDYVVFAPIKGARGYTDRLYFEGVNVFFGGRDEIWVEMSGHGCRAFETHGSGNWHELLEELVSTKDYHLTRLDVAFDDRTGLIDLNKLFRETDDQNYVSKFKAWDIRKSNKGITIYHGSEQSDIRFRIYDKARERKREEEGHWVRFEMQLRDDKATMFINKMILQSVGEVFAGVVNNYLRYVTKPPNSNDSRKLRWPTADYWFNLVGAAARQSLFVAPGTEYNLSKLEDYVVNQAGAAAATYINIMGLDDFLDRTGDKLGKSVNPNYQDLLHKYRDVSSVF